MTDKMEPVAWQYRWKIDGEWVNWRVSDASQKHTALNSLEERPLYTADQVKELTDRARNDVLEEALKRITDLPTPFSEDIMSGYEDAYRTLEQLKDQPMTDIAKIEEQVARIAELEGKLEKAEAENSDLRRDIESYVSAAADEATRTATAEAALAEAKKVIEAADNLCAQAAHTATGGLISGLDIRSACQYLLTSVADYNKIKNAWLQANKGDA